MPNIAVFDARGVSMRRKMWHSLANGRMPAARGSWQLATAQARVEGVCGAYFAPTIARRAKRLNAALDSKQILLQAQNAGCVNSPTAHNFPSWPPPVVHQKTGLTVPVGRRHFPKRGVSAKASHMPRRVGERYSEEAGREIQIEGQRVAEEQVGGQRQNQCQGAVGAQDGHQTRWQSDLCRANTLLGVAACVGVLLVVGLLAWGLVGMFKQTCSMRR